MCAPSVGTTKAATPKAALVKAEALAWRKRDTQHVGRAMLLGVVGDDATARCVRDELAVWIVARLECAFALLEVGCGRRRRRRWARRRWRKGSRGRRRRVRRPRRRGRRKRALGVVNLLNVGVQHGRALPEQGNAWCKQVLRCRWFKEQPHRSKKSRHESCAQPSLGHSKKPSSCNKRHVCG